MKQPDSWFNAVSVYHGTILIAPNFAYDMCLKLPEEFLKKLDLSSVRLTVNGSELVRNKTLNALALRMQQFGLNPNSFNPSYGLAENTLVVSSHAPETGYKYVTVDERKLRENVIKFSENGLDIVSCGRICCGMELKIFDLSNQYVLGEDRVGEIWIAGDSVAAGYWLNEAESGFNQSLSGDETEYYATGDLGFMHEEHLYIVGRKKDVIIICGKNLYSQDIEELILNSVEDKLETAVAFAIDDRDDEKLIVIAETNYPTDDQQLIESISNAVVSNCGIIPAEILLRPAGYLIRTNSGKVQRQACKRQYLDNLKK